MSFLECPQKVRHLLGAFFMDKRIKYDYSFKKAVVNRSYEERIIMLCCRLMKYDLCKSLVRKWVSVL